MDPKSILTELETRLNGHPAELEGLDATYRLKLSGAKGGDFYLRIADKKATLLTEAAKEAPTATVSLSDDDFVALAERRASGMALFMEGRIQIEGDMGVALRLEGLLRD